MDTKTVDILIKRYDHGMKLARTDYKPIDLANPTDPMASRLIKNIAVNYKDLIETAYKYL